MRSGVTSVPAIRIRTFAVRRFSASSNRSTSLTRIFGRVSVFELPQHYQGDRPVTRIRSLDRLLEQVAVLNVRITEDHKIEASLEIL